MQKKRFIFLTSFLLLVVLTVSMEVNAKKILINLSSKESKDKANEINNNSILSETEIQRKIYSRTSIKLNLDNYSDKQFGLDGMETPFISQKNDSRQVEHIYNILSKIGVQRFRTGESYWHRLSKNFNDFKELDFQAKYARKHGTVFRLNVGYPPKEFNIAPSVVSTFKSEHENLFRKYINTLIRRYKGIVTEVEVGNEVDYPSVWWVGSGPDHYVRDCRIVKEEILKIDPKIKVVAFAATGSRTKNGGGPTGGRIFVDKAIALGINKYVDLYSSHYTWQLKEKEFTDYLKNTLNKNNIKKDLINTEDASFGEPSEIIKVFARNFFFYGYKSVDYFLAKDYIENGKVIKSGLFDNRWRPKTSLLAYALSVDSMKDRKLIGLSEPSPQIEAYILGKKSKNKHPKYSIIMWRNGFSRSENGELFEDNDHKKYSENRRSIKPVNISGINDINAAYDWKLNLIKYDKYKSNIFVGRDPIVVFTNTLPRWKIFSAKEWLLKNNN